MADVEIIYAHHHGPRVPGEKVKVSEAEARRLVNAGRANYATKKDAAAAGGEGAEAKTARARGTQGPT